ncbi:recombinase family protein [Nocardia sp. CA-128927]|uniref:recombinase family protein n=1 Tax=Nocardia sp. CA-128927 TaxID=3239975 RepID=UPI003D99C40A
MRKTTVAIDAAVLYLRVSTKEQMNTAIDLDPDGLSIHTQREKTAAKAETLKAEVVTEFIESKSAKTLEGRPAFGDMIKYLHTHPEVNYVIVYMRSRAFRNRFDAAIVQSQLQKMGVRLVSVKEDFGEGPYAEAMEGMLDIMNDLQNKLQGLDIADKMLQKAINGGTNGYARLGYLNRQAEIEGKQFNSVELDPKRAPLVKLAWELYATGDYTLDRLEATMADRGLTARARGDLPERPVYAKQFHRMFGEQRFYYLGFVVYKGSIYPGRHEPIVDQTLYERVQDVRNFRSQPGQRDRIYQHYLKGDLFCRRCHRDHGRTSRLIYTEARSHTGRIYEYFVCRSRQEGTCDLPHLPVALVEEAIVGHYAMLRLPPDFSRDVNTLLESTLSDEQGTIHAKHATLKARLAELDGQEERLLDLAADGTLSQAKIKIRLHHIQADRATAEDALSSVAAELAAGTGVLHEALDVLSNPHAMYRDADDNTRRLMNHTFYERFYVDDDLI